MSNSQIKIGMVILMENNLDAAIEFYKKLGFSLKFHVKEKWAEFNIGEIKLGLCPTTQQPFERHTGIVLEVKDLKQIQADLKSKGIEFLTEIKEAPHGLMVSLKDPSGNIMDLYQPTPEKIKEFVQKVVKDNN